MLSLAMTCNILSNWCPVLTEAGWVLVVTAMITVLCWMRDISALARLSSVSVACCVGAITVVVIDAVLHDGGAAVAPKDKGAASSTSDKGVVMFRPPASSISHTVLYAFGAQAGFELFDAKDSDNIISRARSSSVRNNPYISEVKQSTAKSSVARGGARTRRSTTRPGPRNVAEAQARASSTHTLYQIVMAERPKIQAGADDVGLLDVTANRNDLVTMGARDDAERQGHRAGRVQGKEALEFVEEMRPWMKFRSCGFGQTCIIEESGKVVAIQTEWDDVEPLPLVVEASAAGRGSSPKTAGQRALDPTLSVKARTAKALIGDSVKLFGRITGTGASAAAAADSADELHWAVVEEEIHVCPSTGGVSYFWEPPGSQVFMPGSAVGAGSEETRVCEVRFAVAWDVDSARRHRHAAGRPARVTKWRYVRKADPHMTAAECERLQQPGAVIQPGRPGAEEDDPDVVISRFAEASWGRRRRGGTASLSRRMILEPVSESRARGVWHREPTDRVEKVAGGCLLTRLSEYAMYYRPDEVVHGLGLDASETCTEQLAYAKGAASTWFHVKEKRDRFGDTPPTTAAESAGGDQASTAATVSHLDPYRYLYEVARLERLSGVAWFASAVDWIVMPTNAIFFAFCFVMMVPALQASMAEPQGMPSAVSTAGWSTAIIYAVMGVCGYWTYGSRVEGMIYGSMSHDYVNEFNHARSMSVRGMVVSAMVFVSVLVLG